MAIARSLIPCMVLAAVALSAAAVMAAPADPSKPSDPPGRTLQSPRVAPVTAGQPASVTKPDASGSGFLMEPSGNGDAIAQLRRFVSDTRSARGAFSQQTVRGAGRSPDQASGVFAFERPGRFRWEVRKPFTQLMVADGTKLWFLDTDLNQVIERKLSESLGASPAAILFGGGNLEQTFKLQETGQHQGLDWLDALPMNRDAGFERIAIGFRNGLPEAMEVLDAFGRTTRFMFTSLERNPVLDASLFHFVVPPGADLITQ
jgi:outer membrane lipoprotein carrier protein